MKCFRKSTIIILWFSMYFFFILLFLTPDGNLCWQKCTTIGSLRKTSAISKRAETQMQFHCVAHATKPDFLWLWRKFFNLKIVFVFLGEKILFFCWNTKSSAIYHLYFANSSHVGLIKGYLMISHGLQHLIKRILYKLYPHSTLRQELFYCPRFSETVRIHNVFCYKWVSYNGVH